MRHHLGAVFESRELEHAHGAVPHNRAGGFELRRQASSGVRAYVQNQIVVVHLGGFFHRGYRVCRKSFGANHVGGNRHLGTARFHGFDHRFGFAYQVGLGQAFADLQTRSQHEGVGNAAAHNQLIHIFRQRLQDGEFGADLGTGDDRGQRAFGRGQRFADGIDFGGQQRPGASHRRELRDAVSGALGAVRGAECVVHINVAKCRHLLGQCFAVFLFADIDPAVFQHHHLTGGDRHAAHPVRHQRHIPAQQLSQALGDRG